MTVKKILYMISYSCMKRCVILVSLTPHIGHLVSHVPDSFGKESGYFSRVSVCRKNAI